MANKEVFLWPVEVSTQVASRLGGAALSMARSTRSAFDSQYLGRIRQATHFKDELEVRANEMRQTDDPKVYELDQQGIIRMTMRHYQERVAIAREQGEDISPEYVDQVAHTLEEAGVPFETAFKALGALPAVRVDTYDPVQSANQQ